MFLIPFIEWDPVIGTTRIASHTMEVIIMEKYFTIKAADFSSIAAFGADIVGVLNRNFSNLCPGEKETLAGREDLPNLLTFPESPMCGEKYTVLRNGEIHGCPNEKFFLGADGSIDPPKPGEEWEDDYWDRTDVINLGHMVAEVNEAFLQQVKYLVAKSGTSGSTITVEITLDRFHKPQAAVCRLTTPDDYVGRYATHFFQWAEAHNIVLKDGKW